MDPSTRPIPPPWPFLLICAVVAAWIDLGSLHRGQHADSLIPVLVSLQRWTPYFWEQDRYGMLIPWLARPFTHPLANLLVQGFLNVSCGLSAFFLLARYTVREASYPIVAALGATTFLTLTPARYRFDYLMDANYGVWLTLGLGGLVILEDGAEGGWFWGRRLMALALMVLAHWVYYPAALYLGTMAIGRALLTRPAWRLDWRRAWDPSILSTDVGALAGRAARSEAVCSIAVIAAGFLAGMELTGLSKHHLTSFDALEPGEWPHAWGELVLHTWQALAPGGWPLTLGLGASAVTAWCLARGREGRSLVPWREALPPVVAAVVVALFMGTRFWLKINVYVPRYLLPSVILVQASLAMLIVVPVARAVGDGMRPVPPRAIGLALLLGAATAYGPPSPAGVRADLERFGRLTPDLLDAGCTHVAGDYWTVWPAIFHAHLVLRERGEDRPLWGVTFRAQPASELWRGSPMSGRVAGIPVDDTTGENWLRSFGMLNFREVERRPTLRVLRWRPRSDERHPGP